MRTRLALIAVLLAGGCGRRELPPRGINDLREEGSAILAQIKAWETAHGHSPKDLAEIGIDARGRYGWEWRYVVNGQRTRWSLGTGNYNEDGFALYWNEFEKKWIVDR